MLLCALLFVSVVLSLALGAKSIPPAEVASALLGIGEHGTVMIVGELRVNRTVAGLACGAALGVAGALMQALTRNPLADPGLLGVNAGAALGVVVAIMVLGSAGATSAMFFALAGAVLASAVIVAIASSELIDGSPVRLILAGVAFGAVLSGITQALVFSSETVLDSFRFWQVGSLTMRTAGEILPLLVVGAVAACVGIALAVPLNGLALGDDMATAIGVNPLVVRIAGFVVVAVLCSIAIAIGGPISFIGLVSAHIARLLVGPDLRALLPAAFLLGPCCVLLADVAGRTLGSGAELPVGVVAAFLGAPVLLALLARGKGVR